MSFVTDLSSAVQALANNQAVGIPTETVYGLAARIDSPQAIEAIFRLKERPFFDPLIVHISNPEQLRKVVADFPEIARRLASRFWPGPLTLILPKHPDLNAMITAGLDSVGVRMPRHPLALQLIESAGVPLAAPSANKFGKTSPTSAEHVLQEFQKENIPVLDGGDSQIGIESTVLAVKNGRELAILRKGHVLKSELETFLQEEKIPFEFIDGLDKKESPGQMKHHYMPSVPLILCLDPGKSEEQVKALIEAQLATLPDEIEGVKLVKPKGPIFRMARLQLPTDPVLATRQFYAQLRELSGPRSDVILFYREKFHSSERWESLYERITKAASLILQ